MAPESAAPSAAGPPAKTTAGLAPAATHGTPSIPEEFARSVSTSGLQPSASRVSGGRRIRSGMQSDEAAERWIPATSDTMSGYESQSVICRDGHSATVFLTLQLS